MTFLITSCGSGSDERTTSTTVATTVAVPTTAAPTCSDSVPFRSGEGGYASYRIPAVVMTEAGTILAFTEGRRDGTADSGDIETLLRRSTDSGCTWSDTQIVSSVAGENRNNPAPVVDPETGQVIVLTLGRPDHVTEDQIRGGTVPAEESMRIYAQTSDDDGVTFTDPTEITDQIKADDWRWYAVGPGHGIVLAEGPDKGRIVFGANHSITPPEDATVSPNDNRFLAAHAIYSDDHGKTWRVGFVQTETEGVVNGNESTAAELPGGDVYFSSRNQYGSADSNRADGTSTDGGETLVAPLAPQESLAQIPVVQASLLQVAGGANAPLLLSAPTDPGARIGMGLYRSTDAGATWELAHEITTDPSAYSDLVQLDDATIGVLYETGETTETDTIAFVRVPIAALTG